MSGPGPAPLRRGSLARSTSAMWGERGCGARGRVDADDSGGSPPRGSGNVCPGGVCGGDCSWPLSEQDSTRRRDVSEPFYERRPRCTLLKKAPLPEGRSTLSPDCAVTECHRHSSLTRMAHLVTAAARSNPVLVDLCPHQALAERVWIGFHQCVKSHPRYPRDRQITAYIACRMMVGP